jgi:hypothetical protein
MTFEKDVVFAAAAGAPVVVGLQAVTGTRSTCHCSCACGTTPHVVSPAHSALAGHSDSHTTAPLRAYRHSKPAAHPPAPARRPDPAPTSGKPPSTTGSPVLVVKTVTADTAIAAEAAGGNTVRMPRAKFGGYTAPAVERTASQRHGLVQSVPGLGRGEQDGDDMVMAVGCVSWHVWDGHLFASVLGVDWPCLNMDLQWTGG